LTRTPPARYRWRVVNPELLVRGAAIAIGLCFGAIGTTVMLATLGVFGDGGMSMEARFIGIVSGLAFIFGGLAAIVGYGIAGGAGFENDARMGIRLRVRIVQYLLGLAVAISLATIATWAALGAGGGRVSAGVACVALWLFVAVLAVTGARQLTRRR